MSHPSWEILVLSHPSLSHPSFVRFWFCLTLRERFWSCLTLRGRFWFCRTLPCLTLKGRGNYAVWNHPNPVFCLLRDPQKSMNCYTTLRILFVTYFTSEIWNGWLVLVAFCRLDRVDRGKLGIFQFIRFSACWEILKKSMNGFSTLTRYSTFSARLGWNPENLGCGTKFIVCAP